MPFDVTLRGSSVVIDVPNTTTAVVPKPTGTVDGDLIIVQGAVSGGLQINPPAGWNRINGAVADTQAFWRRASGEPANWTFTWSGANLYNEFIAFSLYSLGGGLVSFGSAALQATGPATSATSLAITPTQDALVLVAYLEFVHDEPGPPLGPGGLTLIRADGGVGAPSDWAGYIYVASGVSSGTFVAQNNAGDPGNPFVWYSGTYSLISNVGSGRPPLFTDEAFYTPAIRSPSDVVYCGGSKATAFPFFTGSTLSLPRPVGLQPGDLMVCNVLSDGTVPGEFPFLFNPFLSIPVGWTLLPGTFLETASIGVFPPSASWIFYKVATNSEPATYDWVLPSPTLNIWTGIIYMFCNVDPVAFFNKYSELKGNNGSPKAPSLTPDWRNDVSFLAFAEINPPGNDGWPALPNAPAGYVRLDETANQGTHQVGYLGVPNSCSPVPDVFAYTEAQQIAAFGAVRYTGGWFAYSFLLKNKNVVGLSCGVPSPPFPPNPPLPAPSFNGLNNQLLLLALNEGGGGHKFSTYSAFTQMGLNVATVREVELPDKSIRVLVTASDTNTYWLFGGTQDGSITATLQSQPLPMPSQIPRKLWGQKKVFRQMWIDGVDIGNYRVSYSVDEGLTFSVPVPLQNFNLIGLNGIHIIVKITHKAATLKMPLITYLNIDYDVVGLTRGSNA